MSPPASPKAIVCAERDTPPHLVARTRRALSRVASEVAFAHDAGALARAMGGATGPCWLVAAGSFGLSSPPSLAPSATGRPVVGFGAARSAPAPTVGTSPVVLATCALLDRTGGDLTAIVSTLSALPFGALWVSDAAREAWLTCDASAVGAPPTEGPSIGAWLAARLARTSCRLVHVPDLDVRHAVAPRAIEVVTSLQIGGAERVARDLAKHLPKVGVDALLVGLGTPTRARWAPLAHELDLSTSGLSAAARLGRLIATCDSWGADVVHSHLFGPDLFESLRAFDVPHVTTIHNARQGWPQGTRELTIEQVDLVVGCAREVELELRAAGVRAPLRAVPNGIEIADDGSPDARGATTERHRREGRRALTELGVAPDACVVLVVANPRRQKRLDRVPPIASALAAILGRSVAVVWAGGAADRHEEARAVSEAFERAMAEAAQPLHRLGADAAILPLYAAADVLLSTSDWEGLSLAHLEAIAAGLPVVATDVGGAREIAAACSAEGTFVLVGTDATSGQVARAVARVAGTRGAHPLDERFGVRAMTRAYGRLLSEVARHRGHAAREGVVLITNNLSPGGAQSSARRWLLELAARGVRVTAITLEEDPAHPTPGALALRRAGLDVVTVPRSLEPSRAVTEIADVVARKGPEAILFWNALAAHKVMLAETLFDVPVYDVSPGEMYFSSLARYFEAPHPDVVSRSPLEYGARLAGAVVKYEAERERARQTLGCEVHVIPNGVAPRARPPRQAGASIAFGTTVRIHPHKRLDRLLEAFRRAHQRSPAITLAVLGGPDAGQEGHLGELQALAAGLPVAFEGFDDDPGAFLDRLDVFVLVAEPAGCPNASLEAMAAGLPVIATDAGGIRDQIDGGAGVLVPRSDVQALADAMVDLAASPTLRAQLAAGGAARARERFSITAMADGYLAMLGVATGGPRARSTPESS